MYSNGNEAFCGFKKKFTDVYKNVKGPIDAVKDVSVRTHVIVTVASLS